MKICRCFLLVVFLLSPVVQASLVPVNNYTLTFQRSGMYESMVIDVTTLPTPDTFYSVGGQPVNVYIEPLDYGRPGIAGEITWYVNAPAMLASSGLSLLSGTGPLTITVSNLQLKDTVTNIVYTTETNALFQPPVSHVYYVGYKDGTYDQKYIPGAISSNPGINPWQRTPVAPLSPLDPDFPTYGAAYGTPYRSGGMGINFTLPSMYVPDESVSPVWELSFGAGFSFDPVPEPTVLLTLAAGLFPMAWKRRK